MPNGKPRKEPAALCRRPPQGELDLPCFTGAPLSNGLTAVDNDRHLIRDTQRVIASIEALVHNQNAQEEDMSDHAATGF